MKIPLKSSAWSENDLNALKICYEARVSLKVMAQFFGKSENAISKILTRSNIRPVGTHSRGRRPSEKCSYYSTKEDILHLLRTTNNHQSTSQLLKCTPLYYFNRKNARVNAIVRSRRKKQPNFLETWTSLTHLIDDLKKKGTIIIPTEDPTLLRQGFEYVVNGSPTKSTELLRIANIERAAQNLPRIFIEGITDNN